MTTSVARSNTITIFFFLSFVHMYMICFSYLKTYKLKQKCKCHKSITTIVTPETHSH
jgi:hypothetical protein